eukprot:15466032-Heterocapsa_arctica.AAC.1
MKPFGLSGVPEPHGMTSLEAKGDAPIYRVLTVLLLSPQQIHGLPIHPPAALHEPLELSTDIMKLGPEDRRRVKECHA